MPHDISSIFNNQATKDHWIKRGIAYIIDTVIIWIITFIIIMIGVLIFIGSVIGGAMTGNPLGGVAGGLMIMFIFIIIAFLFTLAYWIYLDAKGGTIGKRIMKLRPMALHGEMNYLKAAIRNGSKIVGGFIGGMVEGFIGIIFIGIVIEFVIVLIDVYMGITSSEDPRQKYTDKMAGTIVIRTDIQENIEDLRYIPAVPGVTPSQEPKPESTSNAASEYTLESTGLSDETKTTETKTSVTGADSSTEEGEKLPDIQDELVKKYSELFEIDEVRALALYKAGYKRLEDFKDAIVDDLITVEKINPTIARRIIKKISSEPAKED